MSKQRFAISCIIVVLLAPSGAPASSLYHAILEGDTAAARSALRGGAPPTGLLWQGRRPAGYPLPLAIQTGRYAMARLLLDAGADPNIPPEPAPLRSAITRGNPEIVRLLLARGADRERRDGAGETPLFPAVRRGSAEIVSLLLGFGADPRAMGDGGGTLLEAAIRSGHLTVAELLLRRGVALDDRAARAAREAGYADWLPVKAYFDGRRGARERVVCERVIRSRSYVEVSTYLRREPDVPCRQALEARLGGFAREWIGAPRLVPWGSAERNRPTTFGGVFAEFPASGEAALETARRASDGPLRVRHLHGPSKLPVGNFLPYVTGSPVPETDVRAHPGLLSMEGDGAMIAVAPLDHHGFWLLNGIALLPVGSEIRAEGEEPIHLLGLDILGGGFRVLPEGLELLPGTTLFALPW